MTADLSPDLENLARSIFRLVVCEDRDERYDLLHKSLGDALRWGIVAANVTAQVEPPKRTTEELDLWTPEQAAIFIDGMLSGQGGHYGPLLTFLLASGCRIAVSTVATRAAPFFSR